MGYDMSANYDATPAEEAAFEAAGAARQHARDALKATGQRPRWNNDTDPTPEQAAYELADNAAVDADVTYFRLNVWGMGTARDLMDRLGMLLWVPDEQLPPWPTDAEVAAERTRLAAEHPDWDQDTVHEALRELDTPRLSWVLGDSPHLMGHKLCSNDPWVITPAECRAVTSRWEQLRGTPALAAALAAGSDPIATEHHGNTTALPRWWDRWMAWHARGAARGGYTQG